MFSYESKAKKQGYDLIVGIDEAGRGPLAGPVVASAVALRDTEFQSRIDDSKKLTSQQRETAFLEIFDKAYVGIGIISESVIDEINILQATFVAMSHAVERLVERLPDDFKSGADWPHRIVLLVDGNLFRTQLPYKFQTIIDGDCLSRSISCASIVAKVTRDRILNSYDQVFPQYGFKKHKGYSTPQHLEALRKFGPSVIHRKTFRWANEPLETKFR